MKSAASILLDLVRAPLTVNLSDKSHATCCPLVHMGHYSVHSFTVPCHLKCPVIVHQLLETGDTNTLVVTGNSYVIHYQGI